MESETYIRPVIRPLFQTIQPRALTAVEAELVRKREAERFDWEWAEHLGYIEGNHWTPEASRTYWLAVDVLEAL